MARPVLAEEIDRRLAAALDPVESIRVAYLFGSRAHDSARPDSDLDLAVAYDWRLDDWAREQARRDVIVALSDALGALGERADVVDLYRSFSGVAFQAVARGRCVLARSEEERVETEVRVYRRYDDESKYREAQAQAAQAAFRR